MPELPSGTVTFLFTDIEGSTRLLDELGADAYAEALAGHRQIVRAAVARHGGIEVDTQGDAFFVAFPDADGAVTAAADAQRDLTDYRVRVRMGLHTGTARLSEGGYVGADVHLGARIAAAGHGGQVLLSGATRGLIAHDAIDLGQHRLKDFDAPISIYQLGAGRYPPLKTISNTNLPRPASSLIGRVREIREITARLRDGARLLTLTGPGGAGKTRLAIEAATELVPINRNGVFWVPLAALSDPALVMSEIGHTIGAKDDVAGHVGGSEMLLLLDNFEQVVDAAPELGRLLTSCPNLRLMVTSRERLRIAGEVEYAVPPLADAEAVELFATRAAVLADDAVLELCRRLDNLPLAVELAAARASVLTPAQILSRLSQRLDLLKGGRDGDARQQTLRATVEWSHDLLADAEKGLFARLAVFQGGCTLDAAEQVVEADIDTLQSLVDKSLLRFSDERYWMLETIREYAVEQLEVSGAAEQLRRRHAEHFLQFAEEAEPNLLAVGRERWLDRMESEHDNLRTALDHLESSGETQRALRLAGAIVEFWDQRGHQVDGHRRLASLLRADERPTAARAKALAGGSMLAYKSLASRSGDTEAAARWAEEALVLHRSFGNSIGMANSLWQLGVLHHGQGDHVKAEQYLIESVRLFREVGDNVSLMWATRTLAFIYRTSGDNKRARPMYEESLRGAHAEGDKTLEAALLGALASIAVEEGRVDDAVSMAKTSLRLQADAGDRVAAEARLCSAARVLAALGKATAAARLLAHADSVYEETGAREPWVTRMNLKTLVSIHEQLDEAAFADASRQGSTLTADEATALAIAAMDEVSEAPPPGQP